jgi:hypothetical protein
MSNKNAIFDALEKLEVVTVDVVWNGGGDSGGVESVSAKNKAGKEVKLDVEIEFAARNEQLETVKGKYKTKVTFSSSKTKLSEAIEAFCMDWVDAKGSGGWYNNEGGQGNATFTVKGRVINIDHENNENTATSIGAEEL